MLQHLLVALIALANVNRLGSSDDHPLAPDGRRGFGDESTIQEVVKLLHSSGDEDQEFLARLLGLESEVAVRVIRTRISYEELGYFGLLPRTSEQELDLLHEAFFDQIDQARVTLEEFGEYPSDMARVWPDVSFVLRAELMSTLERDLQELRGGRLFLLAHRDGFADVSTSEAQIITSRMDLAAARIRALIFDFDLLAKSDSWLQNAREVEKELGALALITTAEERMAEFGRIEARLKQNLQAARSVLFTTRLEAEIEQREFARDWSMVEAEKYRVELVPWLPDTTEGRKAPKDVRGLPDHKRYVTVLRQALTGLSIDPLNAELCYYAGLASDFLYGEGEAVQWYDRYLAIRGMRAHETSTTTGKVLSEKERKAYDVVQRRAFRPR